MKLPAIFAATLALFVLCSCNDIECIGDEGYSREVFAIHYVYRNYECKDGTDLIDRTFRIENEKAFGKSITIRQTIGRDEDGQAYIKTSRLLRWEA